MNTVTLKPDDVVRILNMVYSVFLAILARFAIQQTGGGGSTPLEINLLISDANWIPVLLLATYFIFDWLTTNITLPTKSEVSHLLLPPMIVAIVALGGLVAFAFVPSCPWVAFIGVYASLVPWYDIIKTNSGAEKSQGLANCIVIYAIVLFRVATGLFILVIAVFKLWLHPNIPLQASDTWLLIWIAVFVLLKAVRYAIFVPLFHRKAQP